MTKVLTLDFSSEVCSLTPFPNSLIYDFKKMQTKAIEIVGPIYGDYILSDLFFDTEDRYMTWFDWGERKMAIQIASSCLIDRSRVQYQLAHECMHTILQTDVDTDCTYLDDGCAEYFGRSYAASLGYIYTSGGKYQIAYDLVDQLLKIDPTIIMTIRQQIHRIKDIRPQDLINLNRNIPLQLAANLLTLFIVDLPSEPAQAAMPAPPAN